MPEEMTDLDVDQPVAFCDPSVIALFPVRFALSADTLDRIAAGATTIATPQDKDSLSDHELRRIRAGYVYIFGDNDTWRVYRYLADPHNDENSTLDFDDAERRPDAHHQFYELTWTNGANSKWRQNGTPTSYLTVSSTVSKVWIAYSEERWPARMLELLQSNLGLRAKVMREVDLSAPETPWSFKLDGLSSKVSEFMPSAETDPDANQMRYTQLSAESAASLDYLCERNRETARVIVLRDDLGELLDVGALHCQLAGTIQRLADEHYYATSMGDCVDMIRPQVDEAMDHWYKALNSHPLNPEFDTLRKQIADEMDAQETRAGGMIVLMANIFARDGDFSPQTEIDVALNGISKVKDDKTGEAWAYCWFLLGRSWQFSAITKTGYKVMGEVFDQKGEEKTAEWFNIMSKLLEATQEAEFTLSARNLRHFNFAVSSQAYVMAQRWTQSEAGIIYLQKLAKPLGQMVNIRGIPAKDVAGVVRQQFSALNIPMGTTTFNAATGHFASPGTQLLHVPVVEGTASAHITSSGAQHFQALHDADNVLKGAGLMLGLATTYAALKHLSDPATLAATGAGAFAQNTKVQLISELVGLAGALSDVKKMTRIANFGQIRADGLRALFRDGVRFNLGNANVLNMRLGVNGGAINLARLATFANVALMVGTAIAMSKSYEAFVRGDNSAALGNAMVGAGSLVLIGVDITVGTGGWAAVVGLVLIAVGTTITLVADDELTKWLRGSFWGEGYYVYWDDPRGNFSQQLETSKKLADKIPEYTEYYQKELQDFLDLVCGITIENPSRGDKAVDIYCGAIQTPADIARLKVALKQVSRTAGLMGAMSSRTALAVDGVTVDIDYIVPQRVRVRFRNFEPRQTSVYGPVVSYSTVDIEASYPNFGGGTWTSTLTIEGSDI